MLTYKFYDKWICGPVKIDNSIYVLNPLHYGLHTIIACYLLKCNFVLNKLGSFLLYGRIQI